MCTHHERLDGDNSRSEPRRTELRQVHRCNGSSNSDSESHDDSTDDKLNEVVGGRDEDSSDNEENILESATIGRR